MLVSLNWIKKYTELPDDLSMTDLAYDLTMRTVEVEDYYDPAADFEGVVIGQILKLDQHPDADKLTVCQVDVGGERKLQIVCGGSNLYSGQLVVVAVPGSKVRWHGEGEPVEIGSTKLRGVLSEGMICAAEELDLGPLFPVEDDGIIMDMTDFPDAQAGRELADVLDFHDMIIEIDNKSLTNRPDLWGHYGIARELSAIYNTPLKDLPKFSKPENLDVYELKIKDSEACPRYTASVWRGLENRESPFALKKTLHLLGQSLHGLIVDLSNYVMLATGQPNHTYDLAKVGEYIEVRRACEGEQLELLDDIDLTLSSEDLVIANQDKAIGLAGIRGGKEDSITADTRDIVLEVANFKPQGIRRTAKKYDVHTDAAARFEKGLDQARIDQALGYFQSLLLEHFPEVELVAWADSNTAKAEPLFITVSPGWLTEKLGRDINFNYVEGLLRPLGYKLIKLDNGDYKIEVPSWRATGDVEAEADIVEEVARMIGYENFDYIPAKITLESAVADKLPDFDRQIREFLAYRCGLQEVYVYPWIDEEYQKICDHPLAESVALVDPPSPEEKYLNLSLIPALLEVAKKNESYYNQFKIFTSGLVYRRRAELEEAGENLPEQKRKIAGLVFGQDAYKIFREAKGIIEAMGPGLNIEPLEFTQERKLTWADPEVWLNLKNGQGEIIGCLGLLSAYGRQTLSFKRGHMAIFEFAIDGLNKLLPDSRDYKAVPHFPLVDMDFTVLSPEDARWEDVVKYISKRVYDLEFVGEYRDDKMPEGKKSLTFKVYLGKEDGTLTGEEIEAKRQDILKTLKHTMGIEIRDF